MNAPPRYWMNRKVISNEDINREKQKKIKEARGVAVKKERPGKDVEKEDKNKM